ncbi:MAG: hypothetical protein ACRDPD_18435 [Streptosporangiaceae bacterium]
MLTPGGRSGGPRDDGPAGAPAASGGPRTAPEPGADTIALTPEQVAAALGGEIIASYASAGPGPPPAYGPRDASTVLMARGHRVALQGGAWYVDGQRVTAEALEQLAAGPG